MMRAKYLPISQQRPEWQSSVTPAEKQTADRLMNDAIVKADDASVLAWHSFAESHGAQ